MTDKEEKFEKWKNLTEDSYAIAVWESEGGVGQWYLNSEAYDTLEEAEHFKAAKAFQDSEEGVLTEYEVVRVQSTHRIEKA
jgi:hypothetical protein